jgi:Arc/MetJ family transcription regulator
MATNLQIDNQLLSEAQRLGNFKTKRETVDQALKTFIEQHKQLEMLQLEGQIDYADDYDYKRQRKAR